MPDLMTELTEAAVVDFESDPIAPRPNYPPIPCGVAIKLGAAPAVYYAWGHRGHANPHDAVTARAALAAVWASDRPLLFHNAKFDLAVAMERLELPRPPWARVHDTLPALFLLDPRAPDYHLKSASERLLAWPPEERDALIDWLLARQPVAGVTLSSAKKSPHYAGAYVAWTPPDLAGAYARGDVDRTRALALWAGERLVETEMVAAYDRERRLLPVVMDMERAGVRVDAARLERDLAAAETTLTELDSWLLDRLAVVPGADVNLDSGDQLAQALIACGAATRATLGVTPGGKVATNKDALAAGVIDATLRAALRYRALLKNSVTTFMLPWLTTATAAGGRIYTTWNSTRRSSDGGNAGARTGRFSSTPNFQNIPKKVKPLFACAAATTLLPPPLPLPPLPRVRCYVLPEDGHVLIGRDFASQELRVLAHFEDDVLCRAYREQPDLDLHQFVTDTLATRGHDLGRDKVKNLHFAIIYGTGVGKLAEMMGCSVPEARVILDAYFREFPSVRAFIKEVKDRWHRGLPVRTWGGRVYPPEAPRLVDGRVRGWEYKAPNVLVQGSSADLTKEAMIAYYEAGWTAPLLLTVHDELVASAPADAQVTAMMCLRDVMNADRLDVPMRSTGYIGVNWEDKTKLTDAAPSVVEESERGKYGPWIDGNGQQTTNTRPPPV